MIKVLRAPQLDSWRGIVTAYLLIFMRIAPDGLIDNGGAPTAPAVELATAVS